MPRHPRGASTVSSRLESKLLSATCAALLLTGLHAAGAFAQNGAIALAPIGGGLTAPLPNAPEFTFTMPPSVRPSGTATLPFDVACVLLPSETVVPNCAITVRWNSRNGSGGHVHNTNRPPGKLKTQYDVTAGWTDPDHPSPPPVVMDNSRSTGLLGLTYTSPEASGVTDLTGTGVAVVNGQIVNFGPTFFTIGVQIEDLLLASVAGLDVSTRSDMHDSNNGRALQTMIDALGLMAQDFADTLTGLGKPVPVVRVTALSLPLGGLFDYRREWKPPHSTHRFGNDADIGMCELTNHQRIALQEAVAAANLGFPFPAESPAVDVCAPPPPPPAPPPARHWHVR